MRTILCADAIPWLQTNRQIGSVVTSLPDAEEIGSSILVWREWFLHAARSAIEAASLGCPVIFYQTDRKVNGRLESKAGLVLEAARQAEAKILWHKIALRRAVGGIDLHRPGYTHMIACARGGRPGAATADVLMAGQKIYPNAMGLRAAIFACKFASAYSDRLTDPFCGKGTVPAIAEAMGLDAWGIDIDQAQCDAARRLVVRKRESACEMTA